MLIIGKISGINTNDGMINVLVNDGKGAIYNLKTDQETGKKFSISDVYEFDVEVKEGERTQYFILSYKSIMDFSFEEKNQSLRDFYVSAPYSVKELESIIEKYTNSINNKIIKSITTKLLKENHDDYFLYPAATKMHHAYIGGLAYHCVSMLKLADGVILAYPYLNKDYIYAGIMLHDIGKIKELSGIVAPEYSTEGQLIGHLVLGAMEIKMAAKELGYDDTEEAMLLEHMLISHHGMPQYGSAKKPLTAEALVLWYVDSIDSKLRTLEGELEKCESGSFTQPIGVLDKMKMYKA
ncbi:MAG: HD domain-containing protein [Acholeplasmatales bacterium]|nr:HD domain-containing protein [Acholeplasmatales bacterium]